MSNSQTPNIVAAAVLANSGSAAAPTIGFNIDMSSGLFWKSAGVIGLSIGGVETLNFNSSGIGTAAFITSANIVDGAILASDVSAVNGAVKVQKFTVGFAALNTATTGVAALFGTAIPVGAIVVRSFINVTSSFTGSGNSASTLKVGLQDAAATGDVHASGALSVYTAGLVEGVSTGLIAVMKPVTTTAKQLAVIWTAGGTDTTLAAGAMDVYIEYVGA